jgi:hypothetical protein
MTPTLTRQIGLALWLALPWIAGAQAPETATATAPATAATANDKPTGQASVQFVNGNQFDGSVVDGRPNGQGSLHFASGETYIGHTVNGLPHGLGTFTWKSGDRWEDVYDNDQQVSQ